MDSWESAGGTPRIRGKLDMSGAEVLLPRPEHVHQPRRDLEGELARCKEELRLERKRREVAERELEKCRNSTRSRGEAHLRRLLEIEAEWFTTLEASQHLGVSVSYASRVCAYAEKRGYIEKFSRGVWQKTGIGYPGCCNHHQNSSP